MKAAFLANGPGEVWGWCRPLLLEAHRRKWDVDVHLLPCPYASGRELEALAGLPADISLHGSAWDALKCFSHKRHYDAVLQLGGDLLFGRWLAWRQRAPLLCYSYGLKKGMKRCCKVLTSRRGLFSCENLEVVGDLVLDSIAPAEESLWSAPQGKRVAVFPGSRPNIRRKVLPLLREVRGEIGKREPLVELRVLLSPFAEPWETEQWQRAGFCTWTGETASGIAGADLALTQPGTNNLELMYCEKPFMVLLPFSFLRELPLSGMVGMIDKIPWFGAALREKIIRAKIPQYIGKTSWPNRLAHRSVVPELIGDYSGDGIAEAVVSLLSDGEARERQKRKFHELASEVTPGAAERICRIIEGVTAGYETK